MLIQGKQKNAPSIWHYNLCLARTATIMYMQTRHY